MKLKKLFLIICTICFTVALACGVAACGDDKDDVIRVSSVSLSKSELTLAVGAEETLTAIINPSNATDKTVEWYSDDSAIATVDENGVVKGVAVGETTITVSASRKQATCKVTVTESTAVGVSSITLNHQALVLQIGETYTNLVPTVLPANSATVSWSSSNTGCVTVNDKGHLNAVAAGTATITATAGGKSATCAVTVVAEKVVEGIELSPEELELEVDAKGTIKATIIPQGLSATITWTSSKSDIAVVDNGVVTALEVGETVITATAGEKSATCNVTVKAKSSGGTDVAVESVTLSPTTLSMNVGDEEKITATVSPTNATDKNVTWTSSNNDVATVSASGTVTAKAKGTATITATAGGKSAPCAVTVTEVNTNNSIVTYAHAGEESAAFEWKDTDASKAKVEYRLSTDTSYTKIDSQLIRKKDNETVRADVLGLKGGAKYDFRITSSDNTVVYANGVDIASLDRSGYAHVGLSGGVGAYNNDGTLKSNAEVIYLTEANKNSVKNGKSIAEYLASKANNSNPIVVRVVGTVGSATWDELEYNDADNIGADITVGEAVGRNGKKLVDLKDDASKLTQDYLSTNGYNTLNLHPKTEKGIYDLGVGQCDPIRGLNSKATYNSSKDEMDSCWNDCSVSNVKNLTVEGVGEDAEIFQWGFTFRSCNSIEVRNLRFYDYTEDACSFEGNKNTDDSTTISGFGPKNFWVHHNIFDIGKNYWDICNEQDKHDGDGATDFKYLAYVTIAYNRYNDTHKTGLVGGDNKHHQACFTFHHNYYEKCDQRMPLGRQANMHMYNNYYSSSGMYSISLRARAYAYIENCVFTSGKTSTKPIVLEQIEGENGEPSAKVVDCDIQGTIDNKFSGIKNLYQGTRANATDVVGGNHYGLNFEKNLPYTVTNKLATSAVKTTIPNVAGTQKHAPNIKIDGSSQGGGSTGGGNTDNPNPPASFDSTATKSASINVADLVKDGILDINSTAHSINKAIADGIVIKTSTGKVTEHGKTIDSISFTHRIILKGAGNYIAITTGGACTIKVYVANGSSNAGKRTIGLYTDPTPSNPVGNTSELDKSETALLEYNVTTGGTYYLESTTDELGVYRIDLVVSSGSMTPSTGTTYTYVYGGTKSPEFTVPSDNGTANNSTVQGTKISASNSLTLTASGTKIEISMKGFTAGSDSASEWVKVTLKKADGTEVGTIKGTTPAKKAIGDYTFTNEGVLTATEQFVTVEITFEGTDGKNFCITELTIVVY